MTMRRLFVLACLLVVMSAAGATRDPAQYTRYLLPVYGYTQAPPFAVWAAAWWFRNDGDTAADLFPIASIAQPPLGPEPMIYIFAAPSLPAHDTPSTPAGDALPTWVNPPFIPTQSDGPGRFLYLEKTKTSAVKIAGSLQWLDRDYSATPTPLHASPEEAFLRGTRSIFPVPRNDGSRYALRLYALPETLGSGDVTVRVYEMQQPYAIEMGNHLLGSVSARLQPANASLLPCVVCGVPDVTLAPAGAQIFALPIGTDRRSPSTFRFEIEPASPELRWWAVVSVTNNETQQVSLFEP